MRLKDVGGEFGFLERFWRPADSSQVVLPNGDDAAVVKIGGELVAISTDTIVEGDHFSLRYFSPQQIGIKAIESSVSDIVAVGGHPTYLFLSLVLPPDMQVELLEGVYQGMRSALERTGGEILGGDTTHGPTFVVSVTVMGKIDKESHLCPRSGARPGDLVYLTGPVGSSMAGLRLFQTNTPGFEDVKRFHLEPRCRIDLIDQLAPIAGAMIDVSDGVSSEIHHICRASGCGAILREEALPILEQVHAAAARLNESAYTYAWSGGEDFQLLYTVAPEFEARALGTKIGIISSGREVLVERGGKSEPLLNRGYDHFR